MKNKKIIIIGLGYMGSIIKTNIHGYYPEYDVITIDPKQQTPDTFASLKEVMEKIKPNEVYCAFIATPAQKHFEIIKNLAKNGIKNIYCEKPLALSIKQIQKIIELKRVFNLKLAVGYILRNKNITEFVKSLERNLVEDGYNLNHIEITYQKYKDLTQRRETDLGIFEELYHVLDWISYISLNYGNRILINGCKLIEDVNFPTKYSEGKILGTIVGQDYNTTFNIYSSFKEKDKIRLFKLYYTNTEMKIQTIRIEFDNQENKDTVDLVGPTEHKLRNIAFESHNKLIDYIKKVFDWFDHGYLDQSISTPTQNLHLHYLISEIVKKNAAKKYLLGGSICYNTINLKTPLTLSSSRKITHVNERKLVLQINMDDKILEGGGNSIDSYKWANPNGNYEKDDSYIKTCTKEVLLNAAGLKTLDLFNFEICLHNVAKLQTLKFIEKNNYIVPNALLNLLITPFVVAMLSASEKLYKKNILLLYFNGLLSEKIYEQLKALYPKEMLGLNKIKTKTYLSSKVTYMFTLSNLDNLDKNREIIENLGIKIFKVKVDGEKLDTSIELIKRVNDYFPQAKFYFDSNASFKNLYELKNFFASINAILPKQRIIGLEEPLKNPFLLTPKDMRKIEMKFFLDESLTDIPVSKSLLELGYNPVIKLVKPMHIIFYQISLARQLGRTCVVQDLSMINNILKCNLGLAALLGKNTLTEANAEYFLDTKNQNINFKPLVKNGYLHTNNLKQHIFGKIA